MLNRFWTVFVLLFPFCDDNSTGTDYASDCLRADGWTDCDRYCLSQKTENDCIQANRNLPDPNGMDGADAWHYCSWKTLVEISQDANGDCIFGEEIHICDYASGGEEGGGCDSEIICDGKKGELCAYYLEQDARIFLGNYGDTSAVADMMTCKWRNDGTIIDSPEECYCACDPEFLEKY